MNDVKKIWKFFYFDGLHWSPFEDYISQELSYAYSNSIAEVYLKDEKYECAFYLLEERVVHKKEMLERPIGWQNMLTGHRVGIKPSRITSVRSEWQFAFLGKLLTIHPGTEEYTMVAKRFGTRAKVKIHRVRNTEAQLKLFNTSFKELSDKRGSNARILYGWHGSSLENIIKILKMGFSLTPHSKSDRKYGAGLYFSSEKLANVAMRHADVDEHGYRHVLLCKIIVGNLEISSPLQFVPSGSLYDTGVDSLLAPKEYIIWGQFMNKFCLIEHVISIKDE